MELKKFMESPRAKGSTVALPTNEIIEKHREGYRLWKHKIRSSIVQVKSNYYAIIRIPSASVKNFYYDVVFQFTKVEDKLEDSHVKIFSNSPSFVYTFAHVFYNMPDEGSTGMIIDEFDKKIPEKNLTIDITSKKLDPINLHQPAVVRNPYGLPLFDKTLYYGAFHLLEKYTGKSLRAKAKYKREAFLIDNIMSFEKCMLLREKTEQQYQKEKIDKLNVDQKSKVVMKRAIDAGMNVNIRSTKKKGHYVSVKPSKAVNNLKKKAGSTSITKIKKMK